jgi:hypothetical protein
MAGATTANAGRYVRKGPAQPWRAKVINLRFFGVEKPTGE